MSQIPYRANLNDPEFPFVSSFQGRTIISQGLDQHYQNNPFSKGDDDRGIPEALYMHNVMPSIQGYKSASYSKIVDPTADTDFTDVFPVKDFVGNRGMLGVTASGKTFVATSYVPEWVEVTPSGQPENALVSVANVTGTSFICYANFGIFTINLESLSLAPAAISWDPAVTSASITHIGASNNYLLATDGISLYWSSALDVLDFVASQITGAGSGVPTSAVGNIIALSPVGIGFAIYCQGNIVVATFSGNVQYPWIFKEAPNGAGIESYRQVSKAGDDNSNYAWTTSGLLKVTLGGCQPVFPSASDFLGGNIFEDASTDGYEFLVTEYLTEPLQVKVAFIASRFLCLSYGKTNLLTHCIIYDTALKRWGKLRLEHSQIAELSFSVSPNINPTYTELGTRIYTDFARTIYTRMNGIAPVAADAKHSLVLLQPDGTLMLLNTDYKWVDFEASYSSAMLVLGKYQIARKNLVTMQNFYLEEIDSDNNNFLVRVLTSSTGKIADTFTTPYAVQNPGQREYYATVVGVNHSVEIVGSFHLVSGVFFFSLDGNR